MKLTQSLPIDDLTEAEQTKIGNFIAKQLGIEYYCDCSIDSLMCAFRKDEIFAIMSHPQF